MGYKLIHKKKIIYKKTKKEIFKYMENNITPSEWNNVKVFKTAQGKKARSIQEESW